MGKEQFSFLQSQIKALLSITVISVSALLFVIVGKSACLTKVKIQSTFVSEENCNADATGYYYTKCRLEGVLNRKQKDNEFNELKMAQSMFNESKEMNSGEKCVKRLPQAIIVGIQKSGTTALLQFLSEHPRIAACLHPVETQYFSVHFRKPLSWYQNLMPCSYSNQITIEKDPPYFYKAYSAVRIREMNPETKITIIVKEPILRAISMFTMAKEKHKSMDMSSFEDTVSFKTQSMINEHTPYIAFSDYQKHMTAWLENFKLEQILILDGHNFERNPTQELKRVENFLGINSYFTYDQFTFNETKGKFCFNSSGNGMKCLGENKGRRHLEVNSKMRGLLEAYFKPRNEKFFEMVKRRFDWGY